MKTRILMVSVLIASACAAHSAYSSDEFWLKKATISPTVYPVASTISTACSDHHCDDQEIMLAQPDAAAMLAGEEMTPLLQDSIQHLRDALKAQGYTGGLTDRDLAILIVNSGN